MLNICDERCLVVGGGGVALRKIDGLIDQGALVTVVVPKPIPALEELAVAGKITLERRRYEAGEAAGYSLVFAATDDRAVNRQVFDDAKAANVWANVADDIPLCSFHLPARVRRGPFQLAIASGGEAPFVVRRLRQMLERRFGPEWSEWIVSAGQFREAVKNVEGLTDTEREDRFNAFFTATVNPETLEARVLTAEEEDQLLAKSGSGGEQDHAKSSDYAVIREAAKTSGSNVQPGLVSLVGAGPGDPGLMTVRGAQRLHAADAVVYDRLAANAIPLDLDPSVELRCVGKQARHHPVPQEEINALLIRLAKEGKRIVRLKGGDPFVFGRGGEEAEALAAVGIPFEVIPAVTSGIAVPTYAGIPVTHRREAVRVTIVTAHEAVKSDGPQVRWDLLGSDPHQTVLGYMGVTALPRVVEELLAAGVDPNTPAAMIEQGTTSAQRVVRETIANLPEAAERAEIKPPGLFVIGPTVGHADRLDWFGSRPLAGERLLLFRPSEMVETLNLFGAEVLDVPLQVTPAARVVMGTHAITGCLVRNVDELEAVDEERDGPGWTSDTIAWCVGETTTNRAHELGWRRVAQLDGVPNEIELAEALTERIVQLRSGDA